ncbi:MAG TPA: hypothetical protein VE954_33980 [Oligoflexus sp.]|uniref:hypothetical protein n=1 Tax=Oligoflexus sp. TaxID=1971216 RepID=UPI002D40A507|nr:hypothetical protein [Oligoflexus sp.]HYX38137.1 hypothetical protein [Oligoflexus sp.]
MKSWILILPLMVGMVGCKKTKQQNTAELQALIDDSCAQNPVNFIEQEQGSRQQLYVFGPQDAAFRQHWQELQHSFRDSGQDLNGAAKVAFVSQYVPRFLQGCTQFFANAVIQCSRHSVGSHELQRCLEPHNTEFRRYLAKSLKADEKGWIDLESLPAEAH